MLVVPAQELLRGLLFGATRNDQEWLVPMLVVLSPVLEFLLDPLTNLNSQIFIYSDISIIKEDVEI